MGNLFKKEIPPLPPPMERKEVISSSFNTDLAQLINSYDYFFEGKLNNTIDYDPGQYFAGVWFNDDIHFAICCKDRIDIFNSITSEKWSLDHPNVYRMKVLSDDRLATCDKECIYIWNIHECSIDIVLLSEGYQYLDQWENYLIAVSSHKIEIWNLDDYGERYVFTSFCTLDYNSTIVKNGYIACISCCSIYICNFRMNIHHKLNYTSSISRIYFMRDENKLLSISYDKKVIIWDLTNMEIINEIGEKIDLCTKYLTRQDHQFYILEDVIVIYQGNKIITTDGEFKNEKVIIDKKDIKLIAVSSLGKLLIKTRDKIEIYT